MRVYVGGNKKSGNATQLRPYQIRSDTSASARRRSRPAVLPAKKEASDTSRHTYAFCILPNYVRQSFLTFYNLNHVMLPGGTHKINLYGLIIIYFFSLVNPFLNLFLIFALADKYHIFVFSLYHIIFVFQYG